MGSVQDIPLILAAVLMLTVTVFAGLKVVNTVQANTDQSMIDQPTLDKAQTALGVFNIGIVAVNIFFYLVSFMLAYQIRSNPVFALPAVIVLAVNVFFSMEIANIYGAFARVPALTSVANQLPLVETMYSNYALITAVMGGTLVLLIYGKTRTGREVAV